MNLIDTKHVKVKLTKSSRQEQRQGLLLWGSLLVAWILWRLVRKHKVITK